MSTGDALKLGAKLLGGDDGPLEADALEVALLDRTRPRRAFRRIKNDELTTLLS
jgi:proteasome alpha subunit